MAVDTSAWQWNEVIRKAADSYLNSSASGGTADGTATAAAPSYVEGTDNPLSLDLDGNLRVTVASGGGDVNITAVGGNAVTTTIPISGTVGATIADGSNTTQGAIANAAYNGTDPTTGQGYLRAIADAALSATPASTNLTQVAGTSVATGSGVLGAGTQRVVLATDQPAVAVSAASLPLPTGAATLVGQTDVQAPITPATATATKTQLLGGTYLSTLPTFTNAQQGALQVGTRGSLNVTVFGADSAQSVVALADNANGTAVNSGARNLGVMSRATIFNGTSWDRVEKISLVGRLVSSAATTNATSLDASSGTVLHITAMNTTAAVVYLKLYNKASAPTVGTDTPIMTIPLTVSNVITVINLPTGFYFATGIAYALTTGAADADTGAVGAGAVVGLNIAYTT